MPLRAFASWNPFGEHPPYRIGAPDRRQFLGTIKLQPSRSTQNLTCLWHFSFFLKHVEARCKKPSNPIKSPHIITYHFISYHHIYPHYKIRDCCFCSSSCWGCFYSAFACLCLAGSFWRAPPYRIGAPDRRQFLGTIKLQPSRSTQNLTFFWHFFSLKHVEARWLLTSCFYML